MEGGEEGRKVDAGLENSLIVAGRRDDCVETEREVATGGGRFAICGHRSSGFSGLFVRGEVDWWR